MLILLLPVMAFAAEVNSVVFTFDPPIQAGLNQSNQLFTQIKAAIGTPEQPESIAGKISKDGASWLLSKNYSGIQFAIIYPEKSQPVLNHSLAFIDRLAATSASATEQKNNFVEKLLASYVADRQNSNHESLSIDTYGIKLEDFYQLKDELTKLQTIYAAEAAPRSLNLPVISEEAPAIIRVFTWNRITPDSFFSAKFIGEKFCREITSPRQPDYEIIYRPEQLQLFLIATGTQNELFQFYPKIEDFCNSTAGIKSSPDWHHYSKTAAQILVEDSRDLNKKLLQKAWLKHFSADFSERQEISFFAPAKIDQVISMPMAQQHFFSRSAENFPRIIASRSEGSSNIADVAIRLIATPRIISEIVKTFDADQSLSFPISFFKETPQVLSMQFHAENDAITRALAGIRSRILNHLALKNLVSDLPTELSVSIAATADVPPFLLRGWLQQGWPSDPAAYSWRLASLEELAEVLEVSPSNSEALLRKWQLRTITGKSRAQLLTELIAKGLYINSFNLN